jgi:hypothetical protein
MPVNDEAWIYLLEDINDNRYVGSTGALRLEDRLATHKRDERYYNFGIRKGKCSSMKLNLHNAVIKPLMKCENDWDIRSLHESHYINNVYPECVNENRLNCHKKKSELKYKQEKAKEKAKKKYEENRQKQIKRATEWRDKNRDRVNAKRREHYQKNKEKLLQQKKEYYIRSKLKKKNQSININEDT